MRTVWLYLLLLGLLLSVAVAQNSSDQVLAEALKPSRLETNLHRLTDEVGGRVPGTPAMRQAVQWGVEAFKAAGAESVHTEEFSIRASWAEGATAASIVDPEVFKLRAVSVAWAPALAPHQRVRVVDVGGGSASEFGKAGDISGALLLVHTDEMTKWDDLFAEYLKAPPIIDLAVKGKALAIAFQSTRPLDLLYRHTNASDGEISRIPMLIVAREDAGRVGRLLASGQRLYADISIPNTVGGPIHAANVVAELRGRENPDEFVILGAHLDSWDLGTGALDNGCNAALVIDALRAIKASGALPKRSIRFILFSGEEEGMVGSHAYAVAHRNELDKAAGVVVFDSGIGRVTGFSVGGRKDIVNGVTPLVANLKQFDAATVTSDAEWGTDNFDFLLEGVPTLVANQEEGNYLINYHAMSDTFDKVDLQQLKKHVAEAAALTFGLADAAERVGPRLNRVQVEQTLKETHLDEQLQMLGMWNAWTSKKRGRVD
jgi:carboxypeptidase Q